MAAAPFLEAAFGRPSSHTPVWFMRQAGRSLPEYRKLRGDGSILDAIKQPELAAELTMQPVRRYGVDAAVLFSDIVVPAHAVGFGIDVAPGTGPMCMRPLRTSADLARLREFTADDDAPYVGETVRQLAAALPDDVPLLAFAGAPFTVASYLIEGRPSRTYAHTKQMMHREPALWNAVMERLVQHAIESIGSQLRNGASAFQLFDSWAGALSAADYQTMVLPHSTAVFTALRAQFPEAPGIHFGVGCDHLLEPMHGAGPSVLGLDWRTSIAHARTRMGDDLVVQGNLDPALVIAGTDTALAGTHAVLADNGTHPGHIFNLGHGVQPNTDPDVLAAVADLVHTSDCPMTQNRTAVLLMAYGTPRNSGEIAEYYTDIRRGRPPTDEQLADLTGRYEAIGGLSPLVAHTEAQREALQSHLDDTAPGRYHVALGLKHAAPRIETAIAELASEGFTRVVALVAAPHYSALSIGDYLARAKGAAEPLGIEVVGIESWATEPAFVHFTAEQVRAQLAQLPKNSKVLFTAHSLPQRVLTIEGERYADEIRATAEAVATAAGLSHWSQWAMAWQSAGRTTEPWLGPDILTVIDELAVAENDADQKRGVLVCAVGFVADHLEVLYDLDVQAAARAKSHGLAFARTACVNDDSAVMAALAVRVVAIDTPARAS